jgi:poly-gamma-glutamate capsule biosynthesis protein CapA/YwtB (metallophosphatase superfamily)
VRQDVAGPVLARAAAYGAAPGEEYDFRPMFEQVAPIKEAADLAICHLEVPLSRDNADVFGAGDLRTPSGSPRFQAPWQLADAIADAGFDACSTAHNHSSDAGRQGVVDTLDVMEDAGVEAAGTHRDPERAYTPTRLEVGDVDVALLSATYGLNVPLEPESAGMVDEIDVDALLDAADLMRERGHLGR